MPEKGERKPRRSRNSRKAAKDKHVARVCVSARLTDLQMIARMRGIPFGGLSKKQLVKKINEYA